MKYCFITLYVGLILFSTKPKFFLLYLIFHFSVYLYKGDHVENSNYAMSVVRNLLKAMEYHSDKVKSRFPRLIQLLDEFQETRQLFTERVSFVHHTIRPERTPKPVLFEIKITVPVVLHIRKNLMVFVYLYLKF